MPPSLKSMPSRYQYVYCRGLSQCHISQMSLPSGKRTLTKQSLVPLEEAQTEILNFS